MQAHSRIDYRTATHVLRIESKVPYFPFSTSSTVLPTAHAITVMLATEFGKLLIEMKFAHRFLQSGADRNAFRTDRTDIDEL